MGSLFKPNIPKQPSPRLAPPPPPTPVQPQPVPDTAFDIQKAMRANTLGTAQLLNPLINAPQ